MERLNSDWHGAHRMPKNATADERIAWHLEHARVCGCRQIPEGVLALMKQRGIEPPAAVSVRGP